MHLLTELPPEYVYLLGLYLGDGCISGQPRDVYRLRIFLDAKYPGIVSRAGEVMRLVRSGEAGTLTRGTCIEPKR